MISVEEIPHEIWMIIIDFLIEGLSDNFSNSRRLTTEDTNNLEIIQGLLSLDISCIFFHDLISDESIWKKVLKVFTLFSDINQNISPINDNDSWKKLALRYFPSKLHHEDCKYITKTTALKTHYLREKNLIDKCGLILCSNPHRRGKTMSLYRTCNILKIREITSQEVSDKITRSNKILASREKSKENRRKILQEKNISYLPHTEELIEKYISTGIGLDRIIKIKRRFDELCIRLVTKGLSFRLDSKLCKEYILYETEDRPVFIRDYSRLDTNEGNLRHSRKMEINKIVDKMMEMDWLYRYTNYPKILDKVIYNRYNRDDEEERYCRIPVSKIARMKVYKKFHGKPPNIIYISRKIEKYKKNS